MQLAQRTNCFGCWDANGGAVVALDPHDGSVLALASAPTYNPGVYSGRVTMKKLAAQGLTPATAKAKNYPALEPRARRHAIRRARRSSRSPRSRRCSSTSSRRTRRCRARARTPRRRTAQHQVFKNWDPFVNAAIDLPTALAISCDTYFYALGNRFYELPASYGHPLQAWACELRLRPADRHRRRAGGGGPAADARVAAADVHGEDGSCCWRLDSLWKPGDSIQLAIGQKDLLVTPLQMARFYALIANGGKLVTPHLAAERRPVGHRRRRAASGRARRAADQHRPGRARRRARRASTRRRTIRSARRRRSSATSPSTSPARRAPRRRRRSGRRHRATLNQSWWCGYGPYGDPKLVVCALIENGGHGGTAAAPTALKVFEQYFHQKAPSIGAIHSD